MATEFERHGQEEGQGLQSSLVPATTPPSSSHRALTERQLKDKCYKCGKQGHWARDCPSATPTKYSPDAHLFPVLNCLCGVACALRVSQKDTSYGRRYYARNCDCAGKFYKWCDEVEAPFMCECGAGACTINFREGIDGNYIKFYTCRIRTGHGACGFLHFDNPPISWPIEIYKRRSTQSPSHGDPSNITSHDDGCSIPDSSETLAASSLMSRYAIRSRQMDFEKRIYVAENSPDERKAPKSMDLQVHDRVRRLAFPDRLRHFFRCMFTRADSNSSPSGTSRRKRSFTALQGNVTDTELSIQDDCNRQVSSIEKVSSNYLESVSQTTSHFKELLHEMGKLETSFLDFAKNMGQSMRAMEASYQELTKALKFPPEEVEQCMARSTSGETAAAQLEGSKRLKMVDLFQ